MLPLLDFIAYLGDLGRREQILPVLHSKDAQAAELVLSERIKLGEVAAGYRGESSEHPQGDARFA